MFLKENISDENNPNYNAAYHISKAETVKILLLTTIAFAIATFTQGLSNGIIVSAAMIVSIRTYAAIDDYCTKAHKSTIQFLLTYFALPIFILTGIEELMLNEDTVNDMTYHIATLICFYGISLAIRKYCGERIEQYNACKKMLDD